MRTLNRLPLLRFGTILALVSALAACTKGGQFDPTTILDNDMFDSKKPLQGKREPVFPTGVPGATSGIPADLYKGYQPPQQAADNGGAATPLVPDAAVVPANSQAKLDSEPKPKAKPKPKVARAPRTEVKVGLRKQPKPASRQESQSSQSVWPAPPSTAQTQAAQTAWPAPPSTAQTQSSQTVWPAPPSTGTQQHTAQPAQSVWPDPPATGAQ